MGALGPSVLELWWRSQVVFSGCYNHRIKTYRQQLAIGACFGNENGSSRINTWVPHWHGLRKDTGSHRCCDTETVENLPLLGSAKMLAASSQGVRSSLTQFSCHADQRCPPSPLALELN